MRSIRVVVVAAVAVGMLLCVPLAQGGEPSKPGWYRHTLKGMFATFSWQRKRRPWYEHVLWYVPSRVADLVDIVGVEVGAGRGVHGNIRVTRLLQLGAGWEESVRVGLMSRYPLVVEQEIDERALGWWWEMDLRRYTLYGAAPDADIWEGDAVSTYYKVADPAAIGVSLFPGFVGVSADLKLHEALDFVKGFLTIDSLGDDY